VIDDVVLEVVVVVVVVEDVKVDGPTMSRAPASLNHQACTKFARPSNVSETKAPCSQYCQYSMYNEENPTMC
jgi:hypothetical protein